MPWPGAGYLVTVLVLAPAQEQLVWITIGEYYYAFFLIKISSIAFTDTLRNTAEIHEKHTVPVSLTDQKEGVKAGSCQVSWSLLFIASRGIVTHSQLSKNLHFLQQIHFLKPFFCTFVRFKIVLFLGMRI